MKIHEFKFLKSSFLHSIIVKIILSTHFHNFIQLIIIKIIVGKSISSIVSYLVQIQ